MEQLGVAHGSRSSTVRSLWARRRTPTYDNDARRSPSSVLGRAVIECSSACSCPPAGVSPTRSRVVTPLLVDAAFDQLAEHGVVEVPPTEDEMAARSAPLPPTSRWRRSALVRSPGTTGWWRPVCSRPVLRPPAARPVRRRSRPIGRSSTAWAASLGPPAKELAQAADAPRPGFAPGRATVPGAAPLGPLDRFDGDGRIDARRQGGAAIEVLTKSAPVDCDPPHRVRACVRTPGSAWRTASATCRPTTSSSSCHSPLYGSCTSYAA